MNRTTRGRRTPADEVLDHLRTADRFPTGDPRREAAQRRAARAVAATPAVADHPALAGMRATLRRWSSFAPYLLDDSAETELAIRNREVIARELALLHALDDVADTALAAADEALRGIDDPSPSARDRADRAAHEVTARRAPVTASVLAALAACHLADDRRRGIVDWRTRFAFVQGTTAATLRRLLDGVAAADGLAAEWWRCRSALVGAAYSDRRVGLSAPPAALAEHAAAAAAAVGSVLPSMASSAQAAARRIRPGAENVVVIEADGRISSTVAHRPTPRGSLMVAHEFGHTLHALEAMSPEPPGALVGETVACWSALVTGRAADVADLAVGLALGDTLAEELFVSAAVTVFEDQVYELVRAGVPVTVEALDDAWLAAQRAAYSGVVDIPADIGSGWARLPSLATQPGHAISYVWATVLALAIVSRHPHDRDGVVAAAIAAGGVDADEFTALLGFDGDEWIDEGLASLSVELRRLAQLLTAPAA